MGPGVENDVNKADDNENRLRTDVRSMNLEVYSIKENATKLKLCGLASFSI
jgi:hypothetical protein